MIQKHIDQIFQNIKWNKRKNKHVMSRNILFLSNISKFLSICRKSPAPAVFTCLKVKGKEKDLSMI